MECTVHLLASMPVCYIYRQQEGLTERTPAWATSRRPTDEVRSSSHSRSASIPRLREIFAGADEVIGYNVGFDLGFLSAVGVRPREDARITDTMNLFTWFMGRRYKLVDAADHIGYEWTDRAHGSLADALATLAVQRWLEQRLVAE